jgi:hypothetical protein
MPGTAPRTPLTSVWIAVALLATGCSRLSQHPLVVEAVEEVRQNQRVATALGAPVDCSTSVRGIANETDGIASLQFDVSGPKAKGVVAVEGKKTQNTWGVTMLELRPAARGEHISLTTDLEARTGTDTPRFDPSAAPATPSTVAPPPSDIEIKLSPGPPGS